MANKICGTCKDNGAIQFCFQGELACQCDQENFNRINLAYYIWSSDSTERTYKTDFIKRLQRVLGYEDVTGDIDELAVAVLCNHAAVRIEWLMAERAERLKDE